MRSQRDVCSGAGGSDNSQAPAMEGSGTLSAEALDVFRIGRADTRSATPLRSPKAATRRPSSPPAARVLSPAGHRSRRCGIPFMSQALTKPPGSTRSGPLCRSRLRAGKYSNAKLHPCREKGEAADISFDRGESWHQGKGGLISRVWGYGEEGWIIGSSLISSIQAVPR